MLSLLTILREFIHVVLPAVLQVFEGGLEVLAALSAAVAQSLNQHLKQFLVPMSKRLNDSAFRDHIIKVLQTTEINGGREATAIIKFKIPTYNSIIVG